MTDLVGFRSKVRNMLGDLGAARYTDTVLDEGIRWALAKYGEAAPQIKSGEITLSAAGREQSLSSLSGLVGILEVNFPHTSGNQTPTKYYAWYLFQYGGTWYIQLSGDKVPAAGDVLRVVYTAAQTIANLDGASATTVITAHDYLLTGGAAGKAAEMRSIELIESYGKKASEPDKLAQWAETTLKAFELHLTQLKMNQAFPGQSPDGWALDEYDSEA